MSLFLTILFSFFLLHVNAHDFKICGQETTDVPPEAFKPSSFKRADPPEFPIVGVLRHVIFANPDEKVAGIDPQIAADLTAIANELYSTGPFRWILDEFEFIEHKEYYAMQDMFNQISTIAATHNKPHAMNVYWSTSLCAGGGCYCGYAYYPWSRNLKRTAMMNTNCLGAILAHEIGHTIGLFHTHDSIGGAEFVDGTNCGNAGDLICDTSADPLLTGENVDSYTCEYIGNATDSKGDKYQPPSHNVMSYTVDHCRQNFTIGQWDRALTFYSEVQSAFISLSVTATVNDNDIIVLGTSSHPVFYWSIVLDDEVVVEKDTNGTESFNYTITGVGSGEHVIELRSCYEYTRPEDGRLYCTERITKVFVVGTSTTSSSTTTTTTEATSTTESMSTTGEASTSTSTTGVTSTSTTESTTGVDYTSSSTTGTTSTTTTGSCETGEEPCGTECCFPGQSCTQDGAIAICCGPDTNGCITDFGMSMCCDSALDMCDYALGCVPRELCVTGQTICKGNLEIGAEFQCCAPGQTCTQNGDVGVCCNPGTSGCIWGAHFATSCCLSSEYCDLNGGCTPITN